MAKISFQDLLNALFSGDVVEFGFWDRAPAGYQLLPIDIDVPAVNILTPFLGFSIKLLGFPMKFCIKVR